MSTDILNKPLNDNTWCTLPPSLISAKVWLPLDVSNESATELLKYMTLNEIMIAMPLKLALQKPRKYYGLICTSKSKIKLTETETFRHNLYAQKIENSEITTDLLNIRLCTKTKSEPTIMEQYLASLFCNNDDVELTSHLKASIPIAFAHNVVARQYATDLDVLISKEENATLRENVFSFVIPPIVLEGSDSPSNEINDKYNIFYISSVGELRKIKEGINKSIQEFADTLHALGATNILAIVANEISELRHGMEIEKRNLFELDPDRSNCFFADETLTDEDLKEMSALSEEIDNAEDFELCIQGINDSGKSTSSEETKKIRSVEKLIRELAKKIATAKKTLINEMSDFLPKEMAEELDHPMKSLYSSKEYAYFSEFYRRNVLENSFATPRSKRSIEVETRKPVGETSQKRKNQSLPLVTPCRKSTRLSSAANILKNRNCNSGLDKKNATKKRQSKSTYILSAKKCRKIEAKGKPVV